MKKVILFAPFALIFLVLSSFISVSPSEMTVSIKKGKFIINKVKILPAWSLTTCKSALGEPDRSTDGYNITHTYDDLSVVLFEPKAKEVGSGSVSEIQFYFTLPTEPPGNAPKNGLFRGKMQIGGLTVKADMTPAQMLKGLKGWTKTDSYSEHNFRMAQKGLYVYFLFNDSETKLIKCSVGPDKR